MDTTAQYTLIHQIMKNTLREEGVNIYNNGGGVLSNVVCFTVKKVFVVVPSLEYLSNWGWACHTHERTPYHGTVTSHVRFSIQLTTPTFIKVSLD